MLQRCPKCGLLYRDECCGPDPDYVLKIGDIINIQYKSTLTGITKQASKFITRFHPYVGCTIRDYENLERGRALKILEVIYAKKMR
jgi:hypothetical protein